MPVDLPAEEFGLVSWLMARWLKITDLIYLMAGYRMANIHSF